MRESDFGCKQYANWTRFIELAADNDMEAMAKLGLQKCKMIRKGTQVKIETFEYPPGSMNMSNRGADGLPKIHDVCARPRGEPECLWLTNEMLIK